MAYPITNSAGTTLATIPDGTVNSNATSLTLIGKNYAGYGNFLNENFVHLLENFSNNTAPNNPIVGQLWYDNVNLLLKLYTGTLWKPISSSQAASAPPVSPTVGDLWYDTINAQLKVWSGSIWVTIGPSYTTNTGTSGAIVENITDTTSLSHVAVKFYISNQVVGILSYDYPGYTPQTSIAGFSIINPGFNLVSPSTLTGSQFTGQVSTALTLQGVTASQFLRSDQNASTSYQLAIGGGLSVSDLYITPNPSNNEIQIREATLQRNINFYVNTNTGNLLAVGINGTTGATTFANGVSITNGTLSSGGPFVANGTSTFAGISTFQNTLLPSSNLTISIGSITSQFANVYAANFVGNVSSTYLNPTVITAGGTTGANGQYLQSTGIGLQWSTFGPSTVGLGTTSNPQFSSLGVGVAASGTAGTILATNNITAYYSDERLKNKLGSIENALDKVNQLSGFYYEANDIAQSLGYKVKREVGVSAQEVQAVLPEIVSPAPIDNQYLTIDYERITPLLIEAIKELTQELNNLKKSING